MSDKVIDYKKDRKIKKTIRDRIIANLISDKKENKANFDGLVKSFSHNYLIIQPIYIN